ncbi:uncharacterized protein BXIN_0025 [Babesia sp. Xinjiang]|uniref:uncharacterized protein n=1 Tax=Babesia sp. Xinjiang TaxID=462227 RepID=UPI000A236635|nr:uncharacterized protein BXIN_0025 [Babesia sp. Xinjiang]ORM39749.1 hypothetical protein BXIN_0025 [Babesia sp. Xinjiang]
MSSSLRALMRREKASRRGMDPSAYSAPPKIQAVESKSNHELPVTQPVATSQTSKPTTQSTSQSNAYHESVVEEIFELVSDSEDLAEESPISHTDARSRGNNSLFGTSSNIKARSHDDSFEDVTERNVDSYSGSEDSVDPSPKGKRARRASGHEDSTSSSVHGKQLSNPTADNSASENKEPSASTKTDNGTPPVEALSDDIHLYDQLNTAFSSRIEYEREQILGNIDSSTNIDYGIGGDSRSTITSANFGKATFRLPADANLPDGFFDNKRSDAQARGKLTSSEAGEKLAELDRSQAELLNEAQYVQEKYIESWHERRRLEHDEHEHEEVVRELSVKVAAIKGELMQEPTAGVDSVNIVEVHSQQPSPQAVDIPNYDDFDDFSWRRKALI